MSPQELHPWPRKRVVTRNPSLVALLPETALLLGIFFFLLCFAVSSTWSDQVLPGNTRIPNNDSCRAETQSNRTTRLRSPALLSGSPSIPALTARWTAQILTHRETCRVFVCCTSKTRSRPGVNAAVGLFVWWKTADCLFMPVMNKWSAPTLGARLKGMGHMGKERGRRCSLRPEGWWANFRGHKKGETGGYWGGNNGGKDMERQQIFLPLNVNCSSITVE